MVESEKDGKEEGAGLFVGNGPEIRMDIDDKYGADGREKTSLQE